MSLLDDLTGRSGGLGGLAELAAQNPQAVAAVLSMLSKRDTSVGGDSGLAGIVDAFTRKGLGEMVASWISTGPTPPVSAEQVSQVLGPDVLGQFAAKAGVPQREAGGLLASLLPAVIDHMTPQGEVPAEAGLESTLGGLLSSLTR
jgi:uncharacterized protein YidB (DUF937 family)